MRVIMGVGSDKESMATGHLLGRLAFQGVKGQLVHVIERIGYPIVDDAGVVADVISRHMKLQQSEGAKYLDLANQTLSEYGLKLETSMHYGFIANELMKLAELDHADLIAVGSRDTSVFNKLLIGSVTRKLVVKSPQSLLVARGPITKGEGLRIVFATDHSDYANRCLEQFLSWHPRGLKHVTIMTAYPKQLLSLIGTVMENFKGDIASWMEERLAQQNEAVAAKFRKLGCSVSTKISNLHVTDAIEETIREDRADLLVLGAQGHGFTDRLAVGSVSFEQVVSGKSSVLVLRLPH